MQGVGREIVLVDKNIARAEAEADDLRHAVPFAHPLDVRAGDYAPTKDVEGIRDVTLSLPRLLGGQGVLETFPLPLDRDEAERLRRSAAVIQQALDELGEDV
jgi:malate/lactate dehydrogenase